MSLPQRPLQVEAVNEPGRQPDVVPDDRAMVREAVHAANATTQISVHHRRQLAVPQLKHSKHPTLNIRPTAEDRHPLPVFMGDLLRLITYKINLFKNM